MRITNSRRICIVGPSKQFLSGITYYTIGLANTLSQSNIVSVLSIRKLLPKFLFPGKDRVGKQLSKLDYLPEIDVFNGIDYNSPLSWFKSIKFIENKKPEVIIFQWWTSSTAHIQLILGIANTMRTRARCILEMHEVVDPLEERKALIRTYSRLMGRLLKMNMDGFVVHSESDKQLISEIYKIDARQIYVIPLGLYDQYKVLDKKVAKKRLGFSGKIVMLYFGLIRRYKGVPYLIRAFSELPPEIAKRCKLVIAGEVWEGKKEIVDQISKSLNREQIELIDKYLSDDEVSLFFSASDLLILPYLRASQSAVAHIGMWFKKPIIVSRVGGLKESMSEYDGTHFVPPGDSTAILNGMLKFYYDDEKEYSPPQRGWEKIRSLYETIICNVTITKIEK